MEPSREIMVGFEIVQLEFLLASLKLRNKNLQREADIIVELILRRQLLSTGSISQ